LKKQQSSNVDANDADINGLQRQKKNQEYVQNAKARIGINLGKNPRNKTPSYLFHWEHGIALILYMIFRTIIDCIKK